jgi:hypothetical protein
MKRKIAGIVIALSAIFSLGIVGSVECGAPLSKMFWQIPILICLYVSTNIYLKGGNNND